MSQTADNHEQLLTRRRRKQSDQRVSQSGAIPDANHRVNGHPLKEELQADLLKYPPESTVEEAAKKDPNSLYAHCKVCPKESHCCYRAPTIVVLPEEHKAIVERTHRPNAFVKESTGFFTIKKAPGEPCPFLTEERLCSVYDIRPIDCRSWPLTLNRAANPEKQLLEDLDCPPVRRGLLSHKFEKAAQAILSKIPEKYREKFVQLVHRDFENQKIPVQPHLAGGTVCLTNQKQRSSH